MSNVPYNPVDNIDGPPPSPNPRRHQLYDGPPHAASSQDLSRYHLADNGYSPAPSPSPQPSFVQPGAVPRPYPAPFQGAAVGDGIRASFASSQLSLGSAPSYQPADYDSVHGLHFNAASRPGSIANPAAAGPYQGSPLLPPDPYRDDPDHDLGAGAIPLSPVPSSSGGSRGQGYKEFPEKRDYYASPKQKTRSGFKRAFWCTVVILVLLAGVAVPLYFYVLKPKFFDKSSSDSGSSDSNSGSGGSSGGGSGGGGGTSNAIVTGGTGSTVTTDNGTTFTYTNNFGGYWYWDPSDPFNNGAKAQSYTPALNETWDWNNDRIMGVNLGGWLNTEPFISPALYEKYYPDAVDEFTLSQQMAADTASGGLQQLEDHYATFITEEDFAAIAAAGLNWVRLPLPFWAIETWDGEPFLEGVAWNYFLKAIQWARKYGIRINLDFHAVPGSQNGWNHSGRLGQPNFLKGIMGLANADRTLDYIRILIQFISQPQYKDVVPMFGVVNEALTPNIGTYEMYSFYLKVHDIVREITGTGEGNGPVLSLHDGFVGPGPWAGLFPGSDRLALDIHPYFAFGEQSNQALPQQATRACSTWAPGTNSSMGTWGITAAGEFSNAINDCGLYVNGVGLGTRWEATFSGWTGPVMGKCTDWTDYQNWTQDTKDGIKLFAQASMDALVHWFFWTWKIGPSSASGNIEAPFWSYKLGLEQGWMPTDPRSDAQGVCASLGVASTAAPALPATATGGAGAGTISPAFRASYTAWPVTSLSGIANVAVLPTYTATGTMKTLPVPTFTAPNGKSTYDAGSGWFNTAVQPSANVPVAGCTYPDEYNAQISQVAMPTAACTGSRKRSPIPENAPPPQITAFKP